MSIHFEGQHTYSIVIVARLKPESPRVAVDELPEGVDIAKLEPRPHSHPRQ